jgi:EAL domain-containing protein (putative c-di-GMP-specific phosphodiesterase class I)
LNKGGYRLNLSRLAKEIKIVFQPIHDLVTGEIQGLEALARGPDGPLQSPSNLFRKASRERILDEAEMLCFKLALKESVPLRLLEKNIFYNFSPFTVSRHHREIISRLGDDRDKSVIELIEYAVFGRERSELLIALGEFHSEGLRIALDDVGNGDRDFSDICEIPADIMKIDRRLIQGLTKIKSGNAPRYRIILHTLVGLAQKLKMSVIAEGIETEMQHTGVCKAGINLAQGFYLSMPKSAEYWESKIKNGGIKIARGR